MLTNNQRKCIQAFLSGRMELNHAERAKFYREAFRPEIDGTNDLTFEEASELIESIKKHPDRTEGRIAEILGWNRLIG